MIAEEAHFDSSHKQALLESVLRITEISKAQKENLKTSQQMALAGYLCVCERYEEALE